MSINFGCEWGILKDFLAKHRSSYFKNNELNERMPALSESTLDEWHYHKVLAVFDLDTWFQIFGISLESNKGNFANIIWPTPPESKKSDATPDLVALLNKSINICHKIMHTSTIRHLIIYCESKMHLETTLKSKMEARKE